MHQQAYCTSTRMETLDFVSGIKKPSSIRDIGVATWTTKETVEPCGTGAPRGDEMRCSDHKRAPAPQLPLDHFELVHGSGLLSRLLFLPGVMLGRKGVSGRQVGWIWCRCPRMLTT